MQITIKLKVNTQVLQYPTRSIPATHPSCSFMNLLNLLFTIETLQGPQFLWPSTYEFSVDILDYDEISLV